MMGELKRRLPSLGATSHIAKGLIYNFNKNETMNSSSLLVQKIACGNFSRVSNAEKIST